MPGGDGSVRTTASRARTALVSALFWTAVGVVFALPSFGSGQAGALPLWRSLAQWWGWGLLSPLIAWITRALDERDRGRASRLAAHLVAGLLVAALALYGSTAIAALFGLQPWGALIRPSLPLEALRGGFLWGLIVYAMIAGVEQARLNGRRFAAAALRAERVERAFADARLHALRLQLDPHFLFNALHTISAEVTTDIRNARAMIEHLAALLRASLEEGSRHAVTLADELAMLEHYLAIQRARFGDRLRIRLEVPDALHRALVPSLLLQPLVENAVRHGLAPRRAGGEVAIAAALEGGRLVVTVSDDGVGVPTDRPGGAQAGLGLAVTRERVEQFDPGGSGAGTEGRLAMIPRPGGGTTVRVSLPLRSEPADPDG